MATSKLKKILGGTIVALAALSTAGYLAADHYKHDLYNAAIGKQAEAANISKHTVTIGDIEFSYLENELKGKKPTLLLVHGFGAFKENWLGFSMPLKDNFHLVMIDLPGHGETTTDFKTNYDLDLQVERLHRFTTQVIGQPFHMAGSSMGGAISALYAATYPADVLSATLIDPGFINDVKSELDGYLDKGVHPLIVSNAQDFEFMIDFSMAQKPFMPWPMSEVSMLKMADRKALNDKIWQDLTGEHNYDLKEAISRIESPTLIMWGEKDRVIHPGNAEIYKRLIPNSKVHLFENVGHAPMIEIPEQSALVLKNFIEG